MAAIPDRKTLESLRRADLQKLCKDHGLKANMKSDALIDLLIDTAKAASNPRGIKRNPSLRTVSKASTSSQNTRRIGSMIIHGVQEEEEAEEGDSLPQNGVASTSNAPTEPSPPSGPASRTRKAKVTQFRLGVGRPTAAGGSGARAVTKSLSVSRGGRIRGSKSMKPQETAIQEEEEEHEPSKPFDPLVEQPEAGPSGTIHSTPPSEVIPHNEVGTASSSLVDSSDIQQRITDIINPLRSELEMLQSKLERLTNQAAYVESLRSTVAELSTEVATLRTQTSHTTKLEEELTTLKGEMSSLKAYQSSDNGRSRTESGTVVGASLATEHSIPHPTCSSSNQIPSASQSALPPTEMPTQSSLGKRHRTSIDDNITGVIEESEATGLSEGELSKQVVRPTRKRAKLSEREPGGSSRPHNTAPQHQPDDDEDLHLKASVAKAPSFTIFSGLEEPPEPFSDGPPTTRLSDIFTFPTLTPPNGSSIPTVTANAGENQIPPTGEHAFSFSFANSIFQPLTSTPAPHAGAPSQNFAMSIPPPEPPTSPTPAGPSGGYVERAGGRRERNDLFNPLGLPSGSRPSRPQSAASRPASRAAQSQAHLGVSGPPSSTGESTINPTALLRRTPPLSSVLEEEQPPLGGAQPSTPSHDILRSAPLGFMGMAGVVPTLFPPDTPAAAPVRRTMYGTELEGDTRFGDFGVEGVATGFWTGAAPRF